MLLLLMMVMVLWASIDDGLVFLENNCDSENDDEVEEDEEEEEDIDEDEAEEEEEEEEVVEDDVEEEDAEGFEDEQLQTELVVDIKAEDEVVVRVDDLIATNNELCSIETINGDHSESGGGKGHNIEDDVDEEEESVAESESTESSHSTSVSEDHAPIVGKQIICFFFWVYFSFEPAQTPSAVQFCWFILFNIFFIEILF